MTLSSRLAALGLFVASGGCLQQAVVERAYDGDVVAGRYVDPEAYSAVLRGAMAEAGGRLADALEAYTDASSLAPQSPEVWTRIGDVRCRADAHDRKADEAIARALDLDSSYARAWSAVAACAFSRGDLVAAHEAASRASTLDPAADGANALLVRSTRVRVDAATRARFVALTATARDPVVAWDALARWAEGSGDVSLWATALREIARVAPERRPVVARAAEELAGAGETGEARSVAGAAVDATDQVMSGDRPLAARLALDDAIARGDVDLVRRRASRSRLPLDEAAGRALLAGKVDLARALAAPVVAADPSARGCRLVLAAVEGRDLAEATIGPGVGDAPVASAAYVAFGVALLASVAPARARELLTTRPPEALEAIVNGDDTVERPAVALVARGAADVTILPPDARVELAVLDASTAGPLPASGLDVRHEYLAVALTEPTSPRALDLGGRLQRVALEDPIVAAAAGLQQLAGHAEVPPGAPGALLTQNPADPLLAVVALRLADRVGDHEVARRAREALTALGENRSRPHVE
jgi:tetratricopeptide (TPR) repeat protein